MVGQADLDDVDERLVLTDLVKRKAQGKKEFKNILQRLHNALC